MPKTFNHNILSNIKDDLLAEFDRNFERQAFFGDKWATTKRTNSQGTLMLQSGNLRRSIKASLTNNIISFSSGLSYAKIHNEGGKIRITPKMKAYFWYLYKQATGTVQSSAKTKKNSELSEDAKFYKAMALKKVGDSIIISKRQFLGYHPSQDKLVEHTIEKNIGTIDKAIEGIFKHKKP